MKIIDNNLCIYNGSHERINIFSEADLLPYKQVWDFTKTPPELIYTKPDSQVYMVWEVSEINQFAQNHIYQYYPIWKQANITREGTPEEITKMSTFIDAVRVWANQIPLPNPFDGSLQQIVP